MRAQIWSIWVLHPVAQTSLHVDENMLALRTSAYAGGQFIASESAKWNPSRDFMRAVTLSTRSVRREPTDRAMINP
jgi:hypothetical protein